jgi:uncharacterized repeat protein (TIGR03803 family)
MRGLPNVSTSRRARARFFLAACLAAGAATASGTAAAQAAPALGLMAPTVGPIAALRLPPPRGLRRQVRGHRSGADGTVYLFQGAPDGALPYAGVTDLNGVLYGTTTEGGSSNGGVVYSVAPSGELVMHSFSNTPDGWLPYAALTAVNGTLYGATYEGGTYGYGTIFSITPAAHYQVVYNFGTNGANQDGVQPVGNLLFHDGALYGTTYGGGTVGEGTVFKLQITGKKAGKESLLYSFKGGNDGNAPVAGLVFFRGAFYGTTGSGPYGLGLIFRVTEAGAEKIIYAFKGAPDGATPQASLIAYNGKLYGTTSKGGNGSACANTGGCGIVFSLTPKGKLVVLHNFNYTSSIEDGNEPDAALTNVNGTFYSTAYSSGPSGDGVVYSITPAGKEHIVAVFQDSASTQPGSPLAPLGGVIDVGGTNIGPVGAGTVFGVPL